jgi:purine-binding chemotaxis protein CheW
MDGEQAHARRDTLDEILAQRRRAGAEILDVETAKTKVVIFSIGATRLAVPARNLVEILPLSHIHAVPGCPAVIEGVINVRGDIISVIRLGDLLGLDHVTEQRGAAILLGRGTSLESGLRVDRVLDVLDIPEEQIQAPPESLLPSLRAVTTGLFTARDQAVVLLDLDRVFESPALEAS